MSSDDFADLARRSRLRLAVLIVALLAAATLGVWQLQRAIPRQIVLATGVKTASSDGTLEVVDLKPWTQPK